MFEGHNARYVFGELENTNLALGQTYRNVGKMSAELEGDFSEFCDTMRKVFEEDPEKFNFFKVYVILPNNLWVSRHKKYMASRVKKQ